MKTIALVVAVTLVLASLADAQVFIGGGPGIFIKLFNPLYTSDSRLAQILKGGSNPNNKYVLSTMNFNTSVIKIG